MTVTKKKMKEKEEFVPRDKAPIFPMGLRIGISDDICIIEFLDRPSDNLTKVSFSVAISKKHAENMVKSLNKFLNE